MGAFRPLWTLAVVTAVAQALAAEDRCGPIPARCGTPSSCAECGRHAACREKTCQVVCEIRKQKKHVWCVECEEICPLLPGHRHHCDDPRGGGCCDRCAGACGGNCCDACRTKCPVPPRCGHPKSIKKLVKREYEVEVPVYRCVVKYLCDGCCGSEPASLPGAAPKANAAPALPAVPPAPPLPPPTSRADVHDASPTLAVRF